MISHHHINHAIRIIAHHKERGASLFGRGTATQKMALAIDRIREVVSTAGMLGISQTDLWYKCRYLIGLRELDYVMQLMHELFMVQRFEVKTGGKNKTVWRGTDKLLVRNLNDILIERLTEE